MKTKSRFTLAIFLAVLATGAFLNRAAADVTAGVSIWHGYDFYYPGLNLSSTNPPVTYHQMESPSGVLWRQFGSTNGGNPVFVTNDLNAVIHEFTNGLWKLYLNKGDVSEEIYYFAMSVTGVTTNELGNVSIWFPLDGSTDVTNQPAFHWTGPSNLTTVELWAYHQTAGNSYFAALPGTATNWTPDGPLTPGGNTLLVEYYTNNFPGITFTTPTNSSGVPLANWSAKGDLSTYLYSSFSVVAPIGGGGGTGHTNLAHYRFDDSGNLGLDDSGNGNHFISGSSWGLPEHNYEADGAAGSGGVRFYGVSSMVHEPPSESFTNLTAATANSFSLSVWIKTLATTGNDTDEAYYGAVVIWSYNSGTDDIIPVSITGNKVAFHTGDEFGNSQTLHSTSDVSDGNYHHIVVTRNRDTGEKNLYVDGVLETTQTGTTRILNANDYYFSLGGDVAHSFDGLADDLQIYSGVLSASEVAALYNSPGSTTPDTTGGDLVAHYDFDESTVLAPDVSGNGNPIVHAGNFGGGGPAISLDTIAGAGSVSFDGGSYLTASSNLLATIARDFSISVWVKTSQSVGSPGDMAYWGAAIVSADIVTGGAGDAVPIALTAGQVAFNTGDGSSDETLNSTATVNDDLWHHLVVTRNQATGEKQIFIDGALDGSAIGTTVLLDGPQLLTLGAKSDASDPDPASPDSNGSQGYAGLLDDIRIYKRVLSSNEVAFLHSNPGSGLADTSATNFNAALNTTNLVWTTSGATNWFTQTSVTHDGAAAARSGAIGDWESTTLQTVIYGTNVLTFWWKADTELDADYLEFYDNGSFVASLSGDSGWQQYIYDLTDPGQHVLQWTYLKDGSGAAGQDAVFLDEVSLATVPPPAPVTFSLSIYRVQFSIYDGINGGKTRFHAFPSLYSPDTPISYHYVESPDGFCSGYANGGGGSGTTYNFDELINHLTNGNWKLWLNKDTPQEQFFNFTLSTVNFTSNSLGHITITAPLDGATGVSSNTPYQWSGPAGWDSLSVNAFQPRPEGTHYYGSATLPPASTNWPAGPALDGGTNFFSVVYDRDDTANFVTSTPFSTWSLGSVHYQLTAMSWFVVSASAGPPPHLSIARTTTNTVAVTWPSPSTGWDLQQNTNSVSSVNWSNVLTTPLDDGTTRTVIINPPTGNRFYRLLKP